MNYYDEDLLDDLYEGAFVVDKYRNIIYWNDSAARITGYSKAEVLNKKSLEFITHIDLKGKSLIEEDCPLVETINKKVKTAKTYIFKNKSGKLIPIDVRTFPLINKGGFLIGALELFKSRNEELMEKSEINNLKNIMYKDMFSDLYNRKYVLKSLEEALSKFKSDEEPFVSIMLDVSNIYEIHSKYKKNVKDYVLTNISDTILRNIDEGTIACKWSEEKYIIILRNSKPALGMMLADRIFTALEHSTIRWNDELLKLKVKKSVYIAEKYDTVDNIVDNLFKSLE